MMVHRRAVGAVQAACARQQRARTVRGRARLAQGRAAFGTRAAMAAGRDEHAARHDRRGLRSVRHPRADLFDDAGRFMAQRHRHRPRPVAVDHRQVGVAQARGFDPHQHLARPRRVEFEFSIASGFEAA